MKDAACHMRPLVLRSLSLSPVSLLLLVFLPVPQVASAAAAAAATQDDVHAHAPALTGGNERRRLTSEACPTCPNPARSCGAARNEACVTEQSSDYHDGGPASVAVDGNTNQIWSSSGSVSHTAGGTSGWWRVDLEAPSNKIEEVVIYGRDGCCYQRLYNLRMDILDSSGAVVATRFGPANSVPDGVIFRFDLSADDVVGKSVKVANSVEEALSLAEVQVYGHVTSAVCSTCPNLARSCSEAFANAALGAPACPAEQSSDYHDGGPASVAVDGDMNQIWSAGSVTHTKSLVEQGSGESVWWRVDLEAPSNKIEEVVIYGRSDCNGCPERLYDLRMDVLDSSGAVVATRFGPANSAPDGEIFYFDLSADDVVGKSVKVTSNDSPLSLSEVQVYGQAFVNKVFVTSTQYNGNLGGIAGADAKCQARADAVGLSGTYMAWISDNSVRPNNRFIQSPDPYVTTGGGARIASSWTALVDGSLDNPINLNEFGNAVTITSDPDDKRVWTATGTTGNKDGFYCTEWTSSQTGTATSGMTAHVGYLDAVGSTWTQQAERVGCQNMARLYCFQQRQSCTSTPCQNGGTCENTANDGYSCTCLSGFSGTNCESNINDCAPDPCANGVCTDGINSYSCQCDAGWEGPVCDQNVDDCASNPCASGSCIDGVNSFTCNCSSGWTGPLCDIPVPPCPSGDTCDSLARSCGAGGVDACPTFQSSVYIPADGLDRSPSIGNDGKYAEIFHTQNNADEYWRVDLDSNYNIIEQVVIYNVDSEIQGIQSRMNGAILQILDFQDVVVASQTLSADAIQTYTFAVPKPIGASVRLRHSNQFLLAREVEVYGQAITNAPSDEPSAVPSSSPSVSPSVIPSSPPSSGPSKVSSNSPSVTGSASPSTSSSPSTTPSSTPSIPPTEAPCSSSPCQNGATCIDGPNGIGFTCQCTQGFSGSTCGIYAGEETTLSEAQAATTSAASVLNKYYLASWNFKVAEHDLDIVTTQCNDANITYAKSQALAAKLTNDYDQAIFNANKMEQEYNLALSRNSNPAERGRLRSAAEEDWATAKDDMSATEEAVNLAIDARSSDESAMNSPCDLSEDCSTYGGGTCLGKAENTLSSADSTYTLARSSVEGEPLISGRSSVFGYRSSFPLINPGTLDFVYDDNDGDLIPNRFDACPTQKGHRKNSPANSGPQDFCPSGCPETDTNGNVLDSDGDTIPDCEDRCPFDAGIDYNHGWADGALPTGADRDPDLDFKGCPDRDNDGIPDIVDACPDLAGGTCYSGCPTTKGVGYDTDRDGVPDCVDRCPNAYNVGTIDGCPDLDMDGTPDSRDYCMATPGSASFSFQRKLEGYAEKGLNILGCPDADLDHVPNPADLCDAPAFPNQGPIVDGVAQSGDAVVDKSGCPLDSDGDGVFDGIDMCDSTVHSPDNTQHDPRAIVFFPGDDDATNNVLGCPRDTDNDGFVDGIDQCVNQGGLIGADGCPLDSDQDGVSDCISADPSSNCHSQTSLPDVSCCLEKDVCSSTPRGATVNATGCPSDGDNDNVANGIDACPYTTQTEVDLAGTDPSKMTIDMKGCAILTAAMWEPIFVDVTTVNGNGANPGIELLFTVDADLPQVLASRQYNIATEMIQVRILDYNCQKTFDDQTINVDKLLPLAVTVNNESPAFTGQVPFGSSPITVDIALNPDGVVGSPIWSSSPPFDVGNIAFCLSFAILSDTLEPVTVKELKASILVDMSQGFSVVGTDIQRAEAVETTELIDIEYPLNACHCDATNTCVDDNLLDDSFLRQSDSLRLCVSFAEDSGFLPPNYVQMTDVKTFSCSQGGLTITPISNFERQGNGGQLTAVTPILRMHLLRDKTMGLATECLSSTPAFLCKVIWSRGTSRGLSWDHYARVHRGIKYW